MLYQFKSRAAPDLIMLEPNGRRMLQLIGKPLDERQGILQPPDMAAAIATLEAAVAQEEATRCAAEAEAAAKGETLPEPQAVSLRQRATPFIAMLRRCEKAGQDIVWGV